MGAEPGETSLADQAKKYLKQKYNKPGNVFLGVVSRLDAFVSGVIVFARTSKAASRLSEQFRESSVTKKYLAIVAGQPGSVSHNSSTPLRLQSWLRKNERLHRMESFENQVTGGKQAILEYRVVAQNRKFSLVSIDLKTGRKHQIRVQFSDMGCPIFGDRKYDSDQQMGRQIALHACELTISHPTQKKTLNFQANIPQSWYGYRQFSDLLDGI